MVKSTPLETDNSRRNKGILFLVLFGILLVVGVSLVVMYGKGFYGKAIYDTDNSATVVAYYYNPYSQIQITDKVVKGLGYPIGVLVNLGNNDGKAFSYELNYDPMVFTYVGMEGVEVIGTKGIANVIFLEIDSSIPGKVKVVGMVNPPYSLSQLAKVEGATQIGLIDLNVKTDTTELSTSPSISDLIMLNQDNENIMATATILTNKFTIYNTLEDLNKALFGCTDPDYNPNNIAPQVLTRSTVAVKDSTGKELATKTDECYGLKIREYGCSNDGSKIIPHDYQCDLYVASGSVCKDGACVCGSGQVLVDGKCVAQCTDPDNTYNPFFTKNPSLNEDSLRVKNTITYIKEDYTSVSLTDKCDSVDANKITEAYCYSSISPQERSFSCPTGTTCKDGACVTSSCPSSNWENVCCKLTDIDFMNFINAQNQETTSYTDIQFMNYINKQNKEEALC